MSLQVDLQRRWTTKFFMLLLFLSETSQIFRFLWIMKQVSPFSVSHVQNPPTRKIIFKKILKSYHSAFQIRLVCRKVPVSASVGQHGSHLDAEGIF